ncbi:MAG: hypothetical protein WAT91_17645 [Saprospiraceae bacterium]
MKNRISLFSILIIFGSVKLIAQVPVSQEPSHRAVFQNQYIRLLDVRLSPGDTTQFHIHATPSLFLHLSNTNVSTQIMGQEWVKDRNETGKTWYRSFAPDILVHRVTNCDTVPFHVTDLEILSSFDTTTLSQYKHLPFDLLFENEKAVAYGITNKNIMQRVAKNRGPLLAELATGDEVYFHNADTKQSKVIKTGGYLYIDPGTSFYFTGSEKSYIKMVLFEIK